MVITQKDVDLCSGVLGSAQEHGIDSWIWTIRSETLAEVLTITISTGVDSGVGPGTIISALTKQGYTELHNISAYLLIEPDEVMFIAKHQDRFSGLIVGNQGTCSQFANIPLSIAKGNITDVPTPALMAAIQVLLAEGVIEELQ